MLRVVIAVSVPVFIVVQPTGASAPTTRVLAARADRPTTTPPTVPVTTTTTTLLPTTTTTEVVPPITAAPTTVRPRVRATPTTWSENAAPVALTFDDGPNETYTPQILEILARYGVRATFFMVGAEAEHSPSLVQRVVSEGHTVGNHTWDHVDLTTMDDEGFRQQIDHTEEVLNALVGAFVPCVRPPFGRVNQYVRDQIRARGLRTMKWTKDTEDWKQPGSSVIVQRALAGAEPGGVILLHDGGPDLTQTVDALPTIIEGIQARGLRLAPICAAY